jgi:nanoRNase/pAp phosphatase (c-di-AMP/oligoRNAs hydrolase)
MRKKASEKLNAFYHLFSRNDQVLVIINADPDAIASAMAVRRLLWRKVIHTTISNVNVVKRPDNLAMMRLLGVNPTHIDEIDGERFNRVIIVDSQPDHNEAFLKFEPDAVIDHHPNTGVTAPFVDIRPEYGAVSSIMTEYLKAARIKPSTKLATGLFHGIKTDTDNFARNAIFEDVRAFQYLFRYANPYLARKIEQAEMHMDFLKYFKTALENRRKHKGMIYVHLGSSVNPDVCVLIADFFMRINTVHWSIVSGIFDKKLNIIFRNDGIRKNAGRLAEESFGHLGSAGGHKSMARAEIHIADLKDQVNYRDEKQLIRWIIQQVKTKPGKKNGFG